MGVLNLVSAQNFQHVRRHKNTSDLIVFIKCYQSRLLFTRTLNQFYKHTSKKQIKQLNIKNTFLVVMPTKEFLQWINTTKRLNYSVLMMRTLTSLHNSSTVY